jgi:aspartate-semialdehyde dehydrogenase
MVDNSSAFRMEEGVPLVIPEINPEDIKSHKGVIANPNCSTIIMLVPLFPLHRLNPIQRIVVSTYQAASGAGALAMQELEMQAKDVLEGKTAKKEAFPHQIAFNVFSHNSKIDKDGYNEEEVKMIRETQKIFKMPEIKVSATCVRVPVMRAHSEAINVEFAKPFSPEEARKVLRSAPGLRLVDDREGNYFPMPLEASHKEEVLVGRVREDLSHPGGLSLFVSGDQLWKGAALNAIQIAELL